MQVKLLDVQQIFKKLICGEITREEADRWAYERLKAFDCDQLSFSPSADEDKIWDALQYLYGIDLQESPGDYLHTVEDIKDIFEKIGHGSKRA